MHSSVVCFFWSMIMRFIYMWTHTSTSKIYMILYKYSTSMSQFTYPLLNIAKLF